MLLIPALSILIKMFSQTNKKYTKCSATNNLQLQCVNTKSSLLCFFGKNN